MIPFVHRWTPATPPRAVVQIVHGMAEHGGRYGRLADALNAAGYGVFAGDLRGHGRTAPTRADLGFFAESDGWQRCLDDVWQLNRAIAAEFPGRPIFLLGHSMGSYLAQQLLSEHGDAWTGVILSATDGPPLLLAKAGRLIARMERVRLGPRGRSPLIFEFTFGAFNRRFQPVRTPFDWLSRDEAEVDSYRADPLCGFAPSVQLWIDLLDALGTIATPARLAQIPRDLPIYLVSGARDPVSDDTKGVERLRAEYQRAGLANVAHHYYPEARHELLHEINREEVTRDLIAWLDAALPRK